MINISANILFSWWFKADMLQDGDGWVSVSSFSGMWLQTQKCITGEVD